jgi:type IV pilus assembly protein PilV
MTRAMRATATSILRFRGFSIVEALVALVVLSIGMLGIAALYVESLRAGRSAIYRTQAVNLASDMADRIRANRNAGDAYKLAAGAAPTTQQCAPPGTAVCDPATLAQDDLARWLAAIATQLPGDGGGTPAGTIAVAPGVPPTRQYTIEVTWSEPGEPQRLTYVLNMQI